MFAAAAAPSVHRRARVLVVMAAVLALLASSCDLVDPPGDAPMRYRDEVFTSVQVTSNLVYG